MLHDLFLGVCFSYAFHYFAWVVAQYIKDK